MSNKDAGDTKCVCLTTGKSKAGTMYLLSVLQLLVCRGLVR
jgi:hypothetical protein